MRMHALVVMQRRTLYENVDSAKIKVPFYMTDIDILCVASMHRIVIYCIDISMNRYTPNRNLTTLILLTHSSVYVKNSSSGNWSSEKAHLRR